MLAALKIWLKKFGVQFSSINFRLLKNELKTEIKAQKLES